MTQFQVDDVIILHSPFTNEDIEVIYRGPFGYDKSVVYDKSSGWQGAIDNSWLRKEEK